MKKLTEEAIHIGIIDLLRLTAAPDVLYFHVPNGGLRNKREAAKLKRMGVLPGVADIVIVLSNGRTVFVEVKMPAGKLSKDQNEFRMFCNARNFPYFIIRSISEAEKYFKSFGILKTAEKK